jgi:hypothetical protein
MPIIDKRSEPEVDCSDPPQAVHNPRWQTPNQDPALHPVCNPTATLVDSFGHLVDDLRQIAVDFGLRPYRMFSIVTAWSGGEKGRGQEFVVSEVELLPTPSVDVSSLQGEMTAAGLNENGVLRVTEVSPRYTEDDIYSIFHVQPLPAGHFGFIEVRLDCRDGNARRRRFVVSGAPQRRADQFDWSVRLLEQWQPRDRNGTLPSRHGVIE